MQRNTDIGRVMVTGGAGYVGARLVPSLIADGYQVTVLDLYLYGRDVLSSLAGHPGLTEIEGDLRDPDVVRRALEGADAVIHLACISNDPSYDLDPELGKSINYDALPFLVEESKRRGVRRFIYASSSSVYGVKEEERVTEDLPLEPLTDYSRYKMLGEQICLEAADDTFAVSCVRPATVCGYSPRQRLDVIVNLLTGHAFYNKRVKVFGGTQYRPNIHIEDRVDVYRLLLSLPAERVQRGVYNAGYENHTVADIAAMVARVIDEPVETVVEPTDDPRSYRVDSSHSERELGFRATRTVEEAARGLAQAFRDGLLPGAPDDPRYWNIRTMQANELK